MHLLRCELSLPLPAGFYATSNFNMSSTSQPLVKVPEEKRKGISNYGDLLSLAREYKLGDDASRLISKVKPILLRNAVEPDGSFQRTWHRMDPIKMGHISAAFAFGTELTAFENVLAKKLLHISQN
jgi:hypothetical protein